MHYRKCYVALVIEKPTNNKTLIPPKVDCVEIGDTKVIGGNVAKF